MTMSVSGGGGDSSGPLHDSASPPAITVDRVSPLLKTCCLVMSRSVAPCYKCLHVKRQKQCHQVNATAGTTFSYARSYCGMVAVSVRCWQQVSYPIAPGRACVHPSAGTLHTCAYSTGLIGKSSSWLEVTVCSGSVTLGTKTSPHPPCGPCF